MNKLLGFVMPVMFLGTSFITPKPPSPDQNTVTWGYICNKVNTKSPKDAYEIRIKAKISSPWHIFSQSSKGIGLPTEFAFNKNPLLTHKDQPTEVGKMKVEKTDLADEPEKYYESEVVFVDTLYVPKNVKTNFGGSVQYMTCKEGQCLNPKTEKFDIKLENGWKLNW